MNNSTNIKHYEDKNFQTNYVQHLKALKTALNSIQNCPSSYHDPDENNRKDGILDKPFFENLKNFLNHQSKTLLNSKLTFEIKGEKGLLEARENGKFIFFLTSDQFGFTAPRFANNKFFGLCNGTKQYYPYDKYLTLSGHTEESYKFVMDCVYNTRTIGGSFVWPKFDNGQRLASFYNEARGGGLIEDCVDLTLLEIKHFYDFLNNGIFDEKSYSAEYGKKDKLLQNPDRNFIKKWLSYFESFEKYVEFFKFEDFVKYDKSDKITNIIDIFGSSLNQEDSSQDLKVFLKNNPYPTEAPLSKSGRIQKLEDAKILKQMLNNVKILAIRRSKNLRFS